MNTDADYYGRGLSWPLRLGATGLRESAGVAKVEESMRIILGTGHGERVFRPQFGANLVALVFAPNNASTANLARHYVMDALATWEPRIEVSDVRVENDNAAARLVITVAYRLRATRELHTLVYPFYLERPA